MTFSVFTQVIADTEAGSQIVEICRSNGYKHCILVSGRHSQQPGHVIERLEGLLDDAGIGSTRLPPVGPEPDSDQVDQLFGIAGQGDVIVSIGGGSAIDCGKMLSLMNSDRGKATDYEAGRPIPKAVTPHIAVPTTSGSGSEVTPYAVINNSQTGRKFTIGARSLCPTYAILDPALLTSMPPQTSLATAVDAWIQLFEAYSSEAAEPFQSPLLLEGARLVHENLQAVLDDPSNQEKRLNLAVAACYGGIAITNARTGLIHTISVAVAQHYKLDHGWLNGVIAYHVLPFNLEYYKGSLRRFMSAATGTSLPSDEAAAEAFLKWLSALGIPASLEHLDIPADLVPTLVARINQDAGLRGVNPRPITDTDLHAILARLIDKEQP